MAKQLDTESALAAVMDGIMDDGEIIDVSWGHDEPKVSLKHAGSTRYNRRSISITKKSAYDIQVPMFDPDKPEEMTAARAYTQSECAKIKRGTYNNRKIITEGSGLKGVFSHVDEVRCAATYGDNYLEGVRNAIVEAHSNHADALEKNPEVLSQMSESHRAMYDAMLKCFDINPRFSKDTQLVDDIHSIMDTVNNEFAGVDTAMDAARQIQQLVQLKDQEPPPEQEPQQGDGEGQGEGEEGEGQGGDGQADSGDDEGKQGNSGEDGKGDQKGQMQAKGKDGDKEDKPPEKQKSKGDKAGDGKCEARKYDPYVNKVHQVLKDNFKEKAKNTQEDYRNGRVSTEYPEMTPLNRALDVVPLELNGEIAMLKRHLTRALKSHGAEYRDGKTGKICGKRLARLGTGSTTVFRKNKPSEKINTAVSMLMDVSSSMSAEMDYEKDMTERLDGAIRCCGAIAAACNDLGVKTELYFYAGDYGIAWKFDQRMTTKKILQDVVKAGYTTNGGTNLKPCLNRAMKALQGRKEQKKLMFVMSDGETTGPGYCKEIIRSNRNVKVTGIGIGDCASNEVYSNVPNASYVQVNTMHDFGLSMFKELAKTMEIAESKL